MQLQRILYDVENNKDCQVCGFMEELTVNLYVGGLSISERKSLNISSNW